MFFDSSLGGTFTSPLELLLDVDALRRLAKYRNNGILEYNSHKVYTYAMSRNVNLNLIEVDVQCTLIISDLFVCQLYCFETIRCWKQVVDKFKILYELNRRGRSILILYNRGSRLKSLFYDRTKDFRSRVLVYIDVF